MLQQIANYELPQGKVGPVMPALGSFKLVQTQLSPQFGKSSVSMFGQISGQAAFNNAVQPGKSQKMYVERTHSCLDDRGVLWNEPSKYRNYTTSSVNSDQYLGNS